MAEIEEDWRCPPPCRQGKIWMQDGRYTVECQKCYGTGDVRSRKPRNRKCDACQGSGVNMGACEKCMGSGKIP